MTVNKYLDAGVAVAGVPSVLGVTAWFIVRVLRALPDIIRSYGESILQPRLKHKEVTQARTPPEAAGGHARVLGMEDPGADNGDGLSGPRSLPNHVEHVPDTVEGDAAPVVPAREQASA